MLRLIGFLFGAGFVVFLAGVGVVVYVIWETSKTLPEYNQLAKYEPPVMSRVHAANGELLAEYANQRRLFVPVDAIPDRVIHAFLSAEDKNFFKHSGIDWRGIGRAAINMGKAALRGKKQLQGASTITQQVAKNFLLTSERTFDRKLKEAMLAQRIEQAFSTSDKILELYLNEIYLGLKVLRRRRRLAQLFRQIAARAEPGGGGLSGGLAEGAEPVSSGGRPRARADPPQLGDRPHARKRLHHRRRRRRRRPNPSTSICVPFGDAVIEIAQAEAYAEEVRRRVVQASIRRKALYEGGLSIRTTLDPQMQIWARQALTRGLMQFDRARAGAARSTRSMSTGLVSRPSPNSRCRSDLCSLANLPGAQTVGQCGSHRRPKPKSKRAAAKTGDYPARVLMKWARRARADEARRPRVNRAGPMF